VAESDTVSWRSWTGCSIVVANTKYTLPGGPRPNPPARLTTHWQCTRVSSVGSSSAARRRPCEGPPHAFQAAAHVEAVGAKDGRVGLRREMPVLGNPHTFTLERPTNEIGAAVHSDPGGVGAVDVVLGPKSLHLDVRLFVGVGRSPLRAVRRTAEQLGSSYCASPCTSWSADSFRMAQRGLHESERRAAH